MKETALKYGAAVCDTFMTIYNPASKLRHEGKFHYHQGVFLSGMEKFNRYAKDEKYFDYVRSWVDSIMRGTESIYDLPDEVMNKKNLDDLQAGIILFNMYEKTGDVLYKRILDEIIGAFEVYNCNRFGGFWHMAEYPNQMWLDGLYMAGPLLCQYAAKYDRPDLFDKATLQAKLMFEHCYVEEKGLMKHAWACEKDTEWADKETGCSEEFWGRAFGWFVVSLTDILEYLPAEHKDRALLVDMLTRLLKSVVRYQDEKTGLWYQVLDKGDRADNWHESSCSMMFTMALLRAVKRGFLPNEYLSYAEKGVEGVLTCFEFNGNHSKVKQVSRGTMVGNYDYYINREIRENDLHGSGAFLLLMAAILE